jgi:hypothetical protein
LSASRSAKLTGRDIKTDWTLNNANDIVSPLDGHAGMAPSVKARGGFQSALQPEADDGEP